MVVIQAAKFFWWWYPVCTGKSARMSSKTENSSFPTKEEDYEMNKSWDFMHFARNSFPLQSFFKGQLSRREAQTFTNRVYILNIGSDQYVLKIKNCRPYLFFKCFIGLGMVILCKNLYQDTDSIKLMIFVYQLNCTINARWRKCVREARTFFWQTRLF